MQRQRGTGKGFIFEGSLFTEEKKWQAFSWCGAELAINVGSPTPKSCDLNSRGL